MSTRYGCSIATYRATVRLRLLCPLLQSWIDGEDDAGEQRETGRAPRARGGPRPSVRPSVVPDRAQGRHLVSLAIALVAGPLRLVTNPKRSPESLATNPFRIAQKLQSPPVSLEKTQPQGEQKWPEEDSRGQTQLPVRLAVLRTMNEGQPRVRWSVDWTSSPTTDHTRSHHPPPGCSCALVLVAPWFRN